MSGGRVLLAGPSLAALLFMLLGAADSRTQVKPADAAMVARGKYIVDGVARCTRCHTPLTPNGERDPQRYLMGAPIQIQPSYSSPNWALRAPRIAGGPAGTDAETIRELTTGIARTGNPLNPPMPQFRMTREDAEAVLAYLKSLKR